MIDEFTRPPSDEERAELTDLVELLPRPWRNAFVNAIIVGALLLLAFAMCALIWAITMAGWSEMVTGSAATIPGAVALIAVVLALVVGSNLSAAFSRDSYARRLALAEAPRRRKVLEQDSVRVTRVHAISVIEIVLDEGTNEYIYLFELPDGGAYYYEGYLEEEGPWPNHSFDIVCGVVNEEIVWQRVYGTGALLKPSQRIEEPWCYDGFERFIHRHEGEDPFVEGIYDEAPEALLARLMGTRTAGTNGE